MDTAQIMTLVLMVIFFIVLFGFVGRYFQKLSPRTLKYIDYGSFTVAGLTGVVLYLGKGNAVLRYMFLASIVVYFITLRHTIHNSKVTEE